MQILSSPRTLQAWKRFGGFFVPIIFLTSGK